MRELSSKISDTASCRTEFKFRFNQHSCKRLSQCLRQQTNKACILLLRKLQSKLFFRSTADLI